MAVRRSTISGSGEFAAPVPQSADSTSRSSSTAPGETSGGAGGDGARILDLGSDARLLSSWRELRGELPARGKLIVYVHPEKSHEDEAVIRMRACVYVVTDARGDVRARVHTIHARECKRAAAGGSAQPRELDKLTAREREVLTLIADGRTSRAIATQLGISPRTVGAHRSSLMKKLRIHSVAGLVRLAVREGIAPPHTPR